MAILMSYLHLDHVAILYLTSSWDIHRWALLMAQKDEIRWYGSEQNEHK